MSKPRRRPRLPLLLALVVGFAGCTDSNPPQQGTPDVLADALAAPEWQIGDAWTYSQMSPGASARTITAVVTADAGGDWILDTNDQAHALYDAQSDVSFLGPVRKSDLAGSQQGARVQFFDWPLEENKTWSTTWDGKSLELVVTHLFADGRAHIQGSEAAKLYVEYEYSAESKFLSYITFFDDNETEAFRMELKDAIDGYRGDVYRYTILDTEAYQAGQGAVTSGEYAPAAGATELGITAAADCKSAAAGNIGSILTSRASDAPYTPQMVTPTDTNEFDFVLSCQASLQGAAQAVVLINPNLAYGLDYGVVASDGEIDILIEPRTLETITIA
jgi:hypothetical protein